MPVFIFQSHLTNISVILYSLTTVHIDVTRVFNSVLLQQTQQVDSNGEKTIASLYVTWYESNIYINFFS